MCVYVCVLCDWGRKCGGERWRKESESNGAGRVFIRIPRAIYLCLFVTSGFGAGCACYCDNCLAK